MTASSPQPPLPTGGQREGVLFGIMGSLKLKFRLLRDRRVSGWMKLFFLGGAIWIVFPDIVVGPLDDILVLGFLAYWENLIPEWLVNEHRLRLEAENRGEFVDQPSSRPTPPPAQPSSPTSPPTRPTSAKPTANLAQGEVTTRYTAVITRLEGSSVFHLTPRTKEAIEGNTDLKKAIGKYKIKWDHDTFEVGTKREAQVLSALLQHLPGLRVQSPS